MTRQYSEYSDFCFNTTLTRVHSGQMGWTRRETQTRLWSGSHAGLPDTVDRRRLGRSGLIHSEDGTAGGPQTQSGRSVSRQSDTGRNGYQWDIPRKRALFTSDGPDSKMSGSDIPESHSDRPPGYSERLISRRPQDEGGTEGLCSPNMQLEMAVVRLQEDIDDCCTELELARKQNPVVAPRPPRRSGFTSTPVPRYSGKLNWEQSGV